MPWQGAWNCGTSARCTPGSVTARRHPGGDLGTRVEPELVQDVADMAVDGVLGDVEARADLLVAQALGDQPGDLCLPLPEGCRVRVARCGGVDGLAERQ